MLNDIRYAFRTLRQNPGFALTAIISIALAIGANSAIFSWADALLLRPLPVRDAARVVTLRSRTPSVGVFGNATFGEISYPDFVDFRNKLKSFDGMAASDFRAVGFARDAREQAQLKTGFAVTGNFFDVLGVEPSLGRGFRPEEDQVPGRDAVIVLGHDLWKQEFASDPSIAGRTVRLNGVDFTIIGVAPESFTGLDPLIRPAFFVPMMMVSRVGGAEDALRDRRARDLDVKGRLKPGVTVAAADAEVSALAKSLEESYPATNRSAGGAVRTEIQRRLDSDPYDAVLIALLFTIVTVVLLIACSNIANLMLARGRARSREIAVRLAIGASRGRLVRQLMVESLVMALAGGALGVFVAGFAIDIFSTLQIPADDAPVQFSFQLDDRVLYFTLLASVASAILFGLAPALRSTKADLVREMRAGEADRNHKRLSGRYALVMVQVAGSLILLVVAANIYHDIRYTVLDNPGFRTDHRLTMRLDPALAGYTPAQTEQFYKVLIDRTRGLPGVNSAALSSFLPMTANFQSERVIPEGYEFPPGAESARVLSDVVDSGFFETLGVPLLSGRGFLPADRADSPRVAVVNEAFARKYLGEDPIGKRLRLRDQNGPWVEVVGMTVTGKHISAFEPPVDFLYLPVSQNPRSRLTLIAETRGDPAAQTAALRETVRSIDSNIPIFGARTMEDLFQQRSVKVGQVIVGLVGAIGLIGVLLALVGLYAVVSYQVSRRTREIGIRMALGAARLQVMRMILKQAAAICVVGICIGLGMGLAVDRAYSGALPFNAPPASPFLIALMPFGLLSTTLLAAAIPARRASLVDPQQALRQD